MKDHPIPSATRMAKEPTLPPGHEALRRLAEEMGRLVGKFLADEVAKNGRFPPSSPLIPK